MPLLATFNPGIVSPGGFGGMTKRLISLKNNSSLITIPLCSLALCGLSDYKLVINRELN